MAYAAPAKSAKAVVISPFDATMMFCCNWLHNRDRIDGGFGSTYTCFVRQSADLDAYMGPETIALSENLGARYQPTAIQRKGREFRQATNQAAPTPNWSFKFRQNKNFAASNATAIACAYCVCAEPIIVR
jgi:hypothetical protein